MSELDSAASEESFSVDPGDLWYCGRSAMPQIAEAFLEGNRSVAWSSGEDGVFTARGGIAGRSAGPMTVCFSVRDELQRIMGVTAQRVYAAGDAMVQTANRYVETDEEAKADFLKVTQEYERRSMLPAEDGGHIELEDRDERQNVQMPE